MIPKITKHLAVLLVIATVIFFANQIFLNGSLGSIELLGKEIQAPQEDLASWGISQKAPFKYRVAFPFLVNSVHKGINYFGFDNSRGFYFSYFIVSYLCLIAALLSLYLLLLAAIKDINMVFYGALAYVLSVPFIMAFTVPVHTREDFLAYALFNLGLWAIVKRKDLLFVLIAVCGVLTRETLMLLPLLRFLFGSGNVVKTIVSAAIPVISWIGLRIFMGLDTYDKWLGFNWNISNPEQVLVFGYLSFSFLWIPVLDSLKKNSARCFLKQKAQRVFKRQSFYLAFALIFLTTFFFGIYNEIRLLFLFAPFMIVYAISSLKNDIAFYKWLFSSVTTYILLLLFVGAIAITLIYSQEILNELHPINKYDIPYIYWYILLLIYLWPSTSIIIGKLIKREPIEP